MNKKITKQISLFKEQTGFELDVRDDKPYCDGNLSIEGHEGNITLPDNLVVKGGLYVCQSDILKLPKGLVVKGSLDISYTGIKELPDDIQIGDSFWAHSSSLERLPDNFVVFGSLSISYSKITKLPNNLVVGNSLYMVCVDVKELPNNIIIGDSLFATSSSLERLPENLKVGGSIMINDTEIKEISSGVEFGKFIYPSSYIRYIPVNDEPFKDNYIAWVQESSGRKFCRVNGIFGEIVEETHSKKIIKDYNNDLYDGVCVVINDFGECVNSYTWDIHNS